MYIIVVTFKLLCSYFIYENTPRHVQITIRDLEESRCIICIDMWIFLALVTFNTKYLIDESELAPGKSQTET